jgi:hypothetical protein
MPLERFSISSSAGLSATPYLMMLKTIKILLIALGKNTEQPHKYIFNSLDEGGLRIFTLAAFIFFKDIWDGHTI